VHGTTVDHTRWGGVVTALAENFTLYMVDRRGRGKSGDGDNYAIEREFEDVVAVLEATPAPARVLAHSYGAICSMEAALLTTRIEKMVLYEPPLRLPGAEGVFPSDLGQRLAELLVAGDRVGIVETFLREVILMRPSEIAAMHRTSTWAVRVQAAHTIPREVVAASSYRFHPERFVDLRVPTLFLVGNRSPPRLQVGTQAACAGLSGSRVEMLRGHAHAAMSTGPKVFLEKALPFLTA